MSSSAAGRTALHCVRVHQMDGMGNENFFDWVLTFDFFFFWRTMSLWSSCSKHCDRSSLRVGTDVIVRRTCHGRSRRSRSRMWRVLFFLFLLLLPVLLLVGKVIQRCWRCYWGYTLKEIVTAVLFFITPSFQREKFFFTPSSSAVWVCDGYIAKNWGGQSGVASEEKRVISGGTSCIATRIG